MARAAVDSTRPDDADAALARDALDRVKRYLAKHRGDAHEPIRVIVDEEDQQPLALPRAAVELMARVLAHMAMGQGVSIVPLNAELTTQQAADILNVSRPYLIGLLDEGKIEYKMVGTHRRVLAASLMAYQRTDDATRRSAADELSAITQEMGLD